MPSTRLRDFVTNIICKLSLSASSYALLHSSGMPYPIAHYVNYNNYSMPHQHFLAVIIAGIEPQSFAEAMKDERWRQATQHEIQALESNDPWTM